MRDDLNFIEKQYVGKVCRLEIPLQSVANLKRIAEALHGLASRFEHLYHYPYEKPGVTMLEARSLTNRANREMKKIRGKGRPRKNHNI